MARKLAQIISLLLHPLLIPTLGFLLLFQSGFYFSMLNWEAKRIVLLVVVFTTAILPLLAMALLAINPRFKVSFETGSQRAFPLLFASVFYYLGYLLLHRMNAYPVLKILMISAVLVIVLLLLISFKWKISSHMAALGSLTGAFLALSFRTGVYPIGAIITVIIASGLAGSAQLYLGKNQLWHLEAGFALGFTILYLIIYFI
jgi:hypothetical protein